MQSWRSARGLFAGTGLPPAAWLLAFFIIPLSLVWLMSFGENSGVAAIRLTGTWANYARALDPLYFTILLKSLWIAALTTLACLVLGFPVALAITFAQPKTRPLLLLAIMLPFWTNLLIRTYALIAVLRTKGYINLSLAWLWGLSGLAHAHPFVPLNLLYTNFAVILGLVFVNLPFMVLPLYAALDKLDRSLIEASLDLGAGHFRTLMVIVAPLAMPGIISGIIITFVPALGAYLTPDLLGGTDSQLIASVIERQFKRANDWPFGAALSFMLMYITFIAIAAQSWRGRWRGKRA